MTSKKDTDYKSGNQATTVTTNTTTNIRDVGLTGDAAVALASALEQGSVLRDEVTSETIRGVAQVQGQSFNQLIGGAGKLIEASTKQSAQTDDKFVLVAGGLIAVSLLIAYRARN